MSVLIHWGENGPPRRFTSRLVTCSRCHVRYETRDVGCPECHNPDPIYDDPETIRQPTVMHVDSEIIPSTRRPFPWWVLAIITLILFTVIGVVWLAIDDVQLRHRSDPQLEQKVSKLAEREKALADSVKRLTEKRDAARAELIVTTAGLAAAKTALNAEAPVSNVVTQFIVLELHLNK